MLGSRGPGVYQHRDFCVHKASAIVRKSRVSVAGRLDVTLDPHLSKVHAVRGMRRVRVAILVTVAVFLSRVKSANVHRNGASGGRDPCNVATLGPLCPELTAEWKVEWRVEWSVENAECGECSVERGEWSVQGGVCGVQCECGEWKVEWGVK